MKKMKKALFALLVCSILLSSCSKFEEPSSEETSNESTVSNITEESSESSDTTNSFTLFDFTVLSKEELAEYITLGQYKGFESEKVVVEVTDKILEEKLNEILKNYGTWEDAGEKPIQKGYSVKMDYAGYLNGVAFDGGTASDQTIIVGEAKYIDGFEDGLIGVKNGEKVSLNLTFPKDYGVENLNGQAVVFEVTIKEVKEFIVPEISNEIVKDYTSNEYDNIDAFMEFFKDKVYEELYYEKFNNSLSAYWEKAINNATVIKYPDGIIQDYVDYCVNQYSQYATMYGLTNEEFFKQYLGVTIDEFKANCKKEAETEYKNSMVLQAAMYEENFDSNVDETKYNEWLSEQAKIMGTTVEYLLQNYNVDTLESAYVFDTFRKHVYEFRVEVEPTSSEASETETSSEITSETASTEE